MWTSFTYLLFNECYFLKSCLKINKPPASNLYKNMFNTKMLYSHQLYSLIRPETLPLYAVRSLENRHSSFSWDLRLSVLGSSFCRASRTSCQDTRPQSQHSSQITSISSRHACMDYINHKWRRKHHRLSKEMRYSFRKFHDHLLHLADFTFF